MFYTFFIILQYSLNLKQIKESKVNKETYFRKMNDFLQVLLFFELMHRESEFSYIPRRSGVLRARAGFSRLLDHSRDPGSSAETRVPVTRFRRGEWKSLGESCGERPRRDISFRGFDLSSQFRVNRFPGRVRPCFRNTKPGI